MITLAAEFVPTVPASALEKVFTNPIVYGLLLLFVICWLLAEITGKLEGPLNRYVVRRRAVAQAAAKVIGEQPAEIASLRLQMSGLVKDVERLTGEVGRLKESVDDYQLREETRDQLASDHRIWDVDIMARLIDKGERDIPNPPPLHVHPSMFGEAAK